jgi:Amidase
MARTVADAVAVFDIVAGYDPADPVTAASQGKRPDSYLQFLDKDGLPGARIGVLRQLFMGPDTDPEILKLLEQALADMKRQGAEIVEGVNIPEIDEIPPANLFCNRFKYGIVAYLAGLGPQAPVKNLDEILASQKFHPSIEKRMRDAQAEPPPDRNPSCLVAEESGRRLARAVLTDLDLTANRGSVENTSRDLLADIEETIRKLFEERIEKSDDYIRFQDELLAIERHRHAQKEADDYKRRLKRLEAKEVTTINNVEFYSPKSEADLIALVSGVSVQLPTLLSFVIRDYDSHFGFDGLAARNKVLAINETKHLFVEFKLDLKTNFDHTFEKLEAIICWNSRVKDGDSMTDLSGMKATYSITSDEKGTKKRFILVQGSPHNVEVIVFRELLEQHGYKFRPIGE